MQTSTPLHSHSQPCASTNQPQIVRKARLVTLLVWRRSPGTDLGVGATLLRHNAAIRFVGVETGSRWKELGLL